MSTFYPSSSRPKIYFERDPSIDCQDPAIDPSYADNYHPDYAACADPPANTNIVCTYWTNPVSLAGATNTGQYRGSVFQVVEAGSNGYNMVTKPKEYPGYTVKTYVGNLDNTVAVFAGILSVVSRGYITYRGASFRAGMC